MPQEDMEYAVFFICVDRPACTLAGKCSYSLHSVACLYEARRQVGYAYAVVAFILLLLI